MLVWNSHGVYLPSSPGCTPIKRDVLVLTIQNVYVFVLQQLGKVMALSDLNDVLLKQCSLYKNMHGYFVSNPFSKRHRIFFMNGSGFF